MRLVEATLHNYKSIATETKLVVDSRATNLLGKSESGKTNILEGIWAAHVKGVQYEENDRCSWIVPPSNDTIVARLKFLIESDDMDRAASAGIQLTPGGHIEVGRRWDGLLTLLSSPSAGSTLQLAAEAEAALRRLRARCRSLARSISNNNPLLPTGTGEDLSDGLENLARKLQSKGSKDDLDGSLKEASALAADLRGTIVTANKAFLLYDGTSTQRRMTQIANDIETERNSDNWVEVEIQLVSSSDLEELLPSCELISDDEIDLLPDVVSIQKLALTPSDFPLIVNLLALGGATVATLQIQDKTERNRQLDRAQEAISDLLSGLWRQERVRLEFDVEGDEFRIELKGPEGHYGRPGQRSLSFRWFVSFYLDLLALGALQPSLQTNTILLLDEPGLRLHASAQQDLLEVFEKAGSRVQVIYTTHSPFMINKNFPSRIRLVEKDPYPRGTYINNKPYHSQAGMMWEPVRTAIGITAGNSLFIGGNNLIVEGISDQILLTAFARLASEWEGQVVFDLQRVAISAAGGADSVRPLAALCASSCESAVVLLDADAKGAGARARILKSGVLPPGKILSVSDAAGGATTLEDLIDPQLYYECAVEAYSQITGHPASTGFPSDSPLSSPLAGSYKDLFADKGADWGDFDKVLVATSVAQRCAAYDETGPHREKLQTTMEGFKALLMAIDAAMAVPMKKT